MFLEMHPWEVSELRRRYTRMAAGLLAASGLAVVGYVALSDSEPDMDRQSYEAGYDALGGAWLPPSEDDRQVDEAYCEQLWGGFPSDELVGLVKRDWIAGCADFREGRDSRF